MVVASGGVRTSDRCIIVANSIGKVSGCCAALHCAVLQAPDVEYEGPTALAAVKQPETPYSKLLKELHDR